MATTARSSDVAGSRVRRRVPEATTTDQRPEHPQRGVRPRGEGRDTGRRRPHPGGDRRQGPHGGDPERAEPSPARGPPTAACGKRRTPPTARAPMTTVFAPPSPHARGPPPVPTTGERSARTRRHVTTRCGTAAYPSSTVHWPTTSRSMTKGFQMAAQRCNRPGRRAQVGRPGRARAGRRRRRPGRGCPRGRAPGRGPRRPPSRGRPPPRRWAPRAAPACSCPA